jgi:hypothetical protein
MEKHLDARSYLDAAYLRGYMTGLWVLVNDKKNIANEVPLFYVLGATRQARTFVQYRRVASRASVLHPRAFAAARRIVRGKGDGGELHHRPLVDLFFDDDDDE